MMTLFAPITNFFQIIFDWLYKFVVGLGVTEGSGLAYVLAITILTVVIRACLLPFNIKSAKSNQAMQEIQPEVKKLQEKYKDYKINIVDIISNYVPLTKRGKNYFGVCFFVLQFC